MDTEVGGRVLIIGAGHAGTEASFSLRKAGWKGEIILMNEEEGLPYQRPPLSKAYLMGELAGSKLDIKSADSFKNAGVDLRCSMRATEIDRDNRRVKFESGESVSYSKLILATGTRPRRLGLSDLEPKDVFYIRKKEDVDRLQLMQRRQQSVLFVGGGFIGLEAAASATKLGLKVTVMEAQDRLLKRVTSEPVSEFFLDLHRQSGVDVLLACELHTINRLSHGYSATTKDGRQINFDFMVVGVGVVPNQELAEQSGLQCDNGILTNEFAETDDPDVYAIGDCCNAVSTVYRRRIRLESIPNATVQAKVVASSILGDRKPSQDIPWFWSDQYDVKLQTIGLVNEYDSLKIDGDPQVRKFAVNYYKGGELIAVDAVNYPKAFIAGKKSIAEISRQ